MPSSTSTSSHLRLQTEKPTIIGSRTSGTLHNAPMTNSV